MKFATVASPCIIIMEILMLLNFITWHKESVQDYEQRQLDLQVNYSCDAAAQMMLQRTSDIGNDYNAWGSIFVDPQIAYNSYEECMLRNLGWGVSDENRTSFKEMYVPFFCVVSYDGYYMYQRAVNNNEYVLTEWVPISDTTKVEVPNSKHQWLKSGSSYVEMKEVYTQKPDGSNYDETDVRTYDLTWTPKLPFSYEVNEGTSRDGYYAFNLSYDWCYKISPSIDKVDLNNKTFSNDPNLQKVIVSNCLTNACTDALRIAQMNGSSPIMYIPPNTDKTNSITGPSVITYVDPYYGKISYGTTVFAVGGSKIDSSDYVLCYKLPDGSKRYTYAYNRQKLLDSYASKGIDVNITKMYTSPRLAAEKGYYFDLMVME